VSEYFDTPVLVFSANAGELGERARKLIADCPAPITTPHALAECFNALTYRLGFPPKDARRLISENTARFSFIPLNADDYRAAVDRVVENGLTGDKIYDALHVGAALKGKADKIHTSNRRDFAALKPGIPISTVGP